MSCSDWRVRIEEDIERNSRHLYTAAVTVWKQSWSRKQGIPRHCIERSERHGEGSPDLLNRADANAFATSY